ncbi:MAG: sugar transferase [Gemmatimonadales bacterium]
MVKRFFDVVVAAVGLVLLSPLLLAIAAVIKAYDGGPVFYRGERVGLEGMPFQILKFRTMVPNADPAGASSTSQDDPRITSVGRFLRAYKLDELPQLFNVFRGDMSLVGPRPQVAWAVALYSTEERELLSVRPGMTDYASIRFSNEGEILKGSSDPDRDYLARIAPEKIRLGLLYARHHSLRADIRIILATLVSLVGGDPERFLAIPAAARSRRVDSQASEIP